MSSSTTIKLQKNIPMPAPKNKYPFADMKIGDSFFIKDEPGKPATRVVQPAAAHYKRIDSSFDYRTRQMDGGVRLWRIAPITK